MSTENGLQAISPLRRLSILSLRSRNSVHVSQDEILLLDDCRRMVKDVNKSIAAFKVMLQNIGTGEHDTPEHREDIRKVRRKALDFCRKAKTRMLPAVRNTSQEQNKDLYRYFNQLIHCMQIFVIELKISFRLSKQFPVKLEEKPPAEKTPLQTAGEQIQIKISDTSNEIVTYDEIPSIDDLDPMMEPADYDDPELGRISKETRELLDLFCDIDDLIPNTQIPDDLDLTGELQGRKVKTKPRDLIKKSNRLMSCCTCTRDYI
ncbi:uncharacterized protein LOC135482482 isoform X2 [Lineus longissimus]|uniref:uncharacterized protein LOC135482482 isoform X2 n=1 Tax=Lineus longissimus TaxID=88925 RepID=UPI00315DC1C8